MPFVRAEDVSVCAFRALTDDEAHDTDHLILGPEVSSYDEVREAIILWPSRSG